jgi:hypothetical protein
MCIFATNTSVNCDISKIADLRHAAEFATNLLYDTIISNLYAQEGQIRILERQNRELRSEVARLDHANARSEGANGELQG